MPEHTAECLRTVSRLQKFIEKITDSAQDDLQNAISCVKAIPLSHRPDYMLACAHEFRTNANRKMEFVTELASVMNLHVVKSVHDRREQLGRDQKEE